MSTMQQAVFVNEIGKSLELGKRPIPSPQDCEVLVRVKATMILPHDTYGRDWGLIIGEKLPAILGANIAGVVEKVGLRVTSCEPGDRVFGLSNLDLPSPDQGGLQNYAILHADAIGKTPTAFSDEQVVTLPTNLITSWIHLFTSRGFGIPPPFAKWADEFDYASMSLVIIGGGTNVGKFAVQLAHMRGIGQIIVIASISNEDNLKSQGATHVIDRHGLLTNIVKRVQQIVDSDGVDYVYDCANTTFELATAILSPSRPSYLRALLPIESEEAEKLKSQRSTCNAAFVDCRNEMLAPHTKDFWTQVPRWLEEGKILPTEYQVVKGLEKVKEIDRALDAYREGARSGPQTIVQILG